MGVATIGSLFSGIGGLELGLERAGLGPTIWQCESDIHCRQVLAKHWPGIPLFEDVREVSHDAERPDIICGGFPCVDISNAGKQAGITGARSGLWAEFARIVRTLRPRFVVVENVAVLAVRGLDVVLGDLAACGYDAVWFTLRASDVGAPHQRERLFVVAWLVVGQEHVPDANGQRLRELAERRGERSCEADERDAVVVDVGAKLADPRGLRLAQRTSQPRDLEQELKAAEGGGDEVAKRRWPPFPGDVLGWQDYLQERPGLEPALRREPHGVRGRMDGPHRRRRLKQLGNAVVPQVAEVVGWVVRGVMEREGA